VTNRHLPRPWVPTGQPWPTATCAIQSRHAREDIRGTVPDHRDYLFLPTPAPWPRHASTVVGAPAPDSGVTVLYRSYPARTDAAPAPFRWDTRNRAIEPYPAGAGVPGPGFLGICIHGRHDPCCGRAGAPLLRRLHELLPAAPVYGVSHLGGDRLAANAILLPSGYLLGRLDSATDEQLRDLVRDGLLPLGHIRGRLGTSPAEAVAEIWFRERYGLRRPADLPTVTVAGRGEEHVSVTVEHAGRRHRLDVRRDTTIAHETTCSSLDRAVRHRWQVIPA
jgi:Sucrase/ferredoxin-like